MGVAGVGGSGGLARSKSFFQKTLEAARGAFLPGFGARWGRLGATALRGDASTGRPSPPDRIRGRLQPFPTARGGRRRAVLRRGGAGWLDGVGRKARGRSANVGRRGTNGEQGERGAAGGHRRRAEQDGEQAQNGRDQAQEASERQEQERGGGHWGGVAGLTRIVYTFWVRVARDS